MDKIREMPNKSPEDIEKLRVYDKESRLLSSNTTALNLELNRLLLFTKGGTNNVMDYKIDTSFHTFYFWQWQIIRDEAEKFYSI